jgi:hypothetical protein
LALPPTRCSLSTQRNSAAMAGQNRFVSSVFSLLAHGQIMAMADLPRRRRLLWCDGWLVLSACTLH